MRFLYADGTADVTTGGQRIQLSLLPAALQGAPGWGAENIALL